MADRGWWGILLGMFRMLSLIGLAAVSGITFAGSFGEQVSSEGIRHSFLLLGNKTAIVGEDCEILWEVPGRSRDGEVLPNGNVLIAFSKEVKEFTKEKKVVFEYRLQDGNKEISTAVRLANGNTMIAEMGGKPRILEVDGKGKIVVECPLQPETDNTHMQTRMARKLANGNYLVPHLLAFAIKEYSPDGTVVRTIKTDLDELGGRKAKNWPFTAVVLENGNVVANLTQGNKTAIFDPGGKVVWVTTNPEMGKRYADPYGGHYLDNGNWVVSNYGQRNDALPDVFELTAEKKVVWEYTVPKFNGAHEIQILTTNGKSVGGRR